MSFFIIRLLQNFSDMILDSNSQDPSTLPPKEWEAFPGRKGMDKFFPKSHLTAYAHVSSFTCARLRRWINDRLREQGGMWVKMTEVTEGV